MPGRRVQQFERAGARRRVADADQCASAGAVVFPSSPSVFFVWVSRLGSRVFASDSWELISVLVIFRNAFTFDGFEDSPNS